MSRHGDLQQRLLTRLHVDACSQETISTRCWPVVLPHNPNPNDEDGPRIEVVYCEWCPECGAADWEVV